MSKKDLVSINPNELKDFLNHIISNNRHLQANGKGPVSVEVIGESGIGKTSSIVQLADELDLNFVKLKCAIFWATCGVQKNPISLRSACFLLQASH